MPNINSKLKNKGFTLLEILIAVAIISLAAFVSIPSLRKFNQDQDISNAAQDLKNLFKVAQANAQSGVVCSNSKPSYEWDVDLTNSSTITVKCVHDENTGNATTETVLNLNQITFTHPDCSGLSSVHFNSSTFRANTIKFIGCSDNQVKIIVNKAGSSVKDNIFVTTGGSIYEAP